MKRKIDVFEAIQIIKKESQKSLNVTGVSIEFSDSNDTGKAIVVTIFYILKDKRGNFSLYLFNINIQSLEKLITELNNKLYDINPKTKTGFTITI